MNVGTLITCEPETFFDWSLRFSLQGALFTWEYVGRNFVCKVITLASGDTVPHTMFCKQADAYKSWGRRQIIYFFSLCKLNIAS